MITVRLKGGMGNQMFEYAFGRALALRNNTNLVLDTLYLEDRLPRPFLHNFVFRNYDLDIFNSKAEIASKKQTPLYFLGKFGLYVDLVLRRWIFKPKGTERFFHFDKEALLLKDGSYLDGSWMSPKYFAGYEDVIRKDFTFKNEDSFSSITKDLALTMAKENCVCVHVRRGDFVKNKHNGVLDVSYYNSALQEISKKIEKEKKIELENAGMISISHRARTDKGGNSIANQFVTEYILN